MSNSPLISVVMSVYNGEKYLAEAIESILKQTYKNFEFIIVDDASTDNSLAMMKEHQKSDNRIIILENKENKGIGFSVALGMEQAQGKYIAKMDADDVSLSGRFEKQVAYMESNKDCGMLATNYRLFDSKGNIGRKTITPTNEHILKFRLNFSFPIANPTLMLRKSILDKHCITYNIELYLEEDYDFITRLVEITNLQCLEDYLSCIRIHDNSTTKTRNTERCKYAFENISKHLLNSLHLDINANPEIKRFIELTVTNTPLLKKEDLISYAKGLNELIVKYIMFNNISKDIMALIKGSSSEMMWKRILFRDGNIKSPLLMLSLMFRKEFLLIDLIKYLPAMCKQLLSK